MEGAGRGSDSLTNLGKRITTVAHQDPVRARSDANIRETDVRVTAETSRATLARDSQALPPALGTSREHVQKEAISAVVEFSRPL